MNKRGRVWVVVYDDFVSSVMSTKIIMPTDIVLGKCHGPEESPTRKLLASWNKSWK